MLRDPRKTKRPGSFHLFTFKEIVNWFQEPGSQERSLKNMKPNSILQREGVHTLPLLLTPNCKTHDAATRNSPPIIP